MRDEHLLAGVRVPIALDDGGASDAKLPPVLRVIVPHAFPSEPSTHPDLQAGDVTTDGRLTR